MFQVKWQMCLYKSTYILFKNQEFPISGYDSTNLFLENCFLEYKNCVSASSTSKNNDFEFKILIHKRFLILINNFEENFTKVIHDEHG